MKTNILFIACIICIFGIFSISCSSFYKNKPENPIIPDNSRGLTTFAINPSRRLVIVKPILPNEKHNDLHNDLKKKGLNDGRFDIFFEKEICGEPPPDVSDNIASALSFALSTEGKLGEKKTVKIVSELARTLNTTAVLLFKRTQGLQLYRDGMYHLCIAKMNGYVDNDAYQELAGELLIQSIKLISEEIPFMNSVKEKIMEKNADVTATETK